MIQSGDCFLAASSGSFQPTQTGFFSFNEVSSGITLIASANK
jgi:hypothetical protein